MNVIRLGLAFFIAMAIFFAIGFYKQNSVTINSILLPLLILGGLAFVWFQAIKLPSIRREKIFELQQRVRGFGGFPSPLNSNYLSEQKFEKDRSLLECDLVRAVAGKVIRKHKKILARKKAQTVYVSDYGKEVERGWQKELKEFVQDVLYDELLDSTSSINFRSSSANGLLNFSDKSIVEYWVSFSDSVVFDEAIQVEPRKDFDSILSGHEYEKFVAELISELGWVAKVTPGSGDHGADIIAEKNGSRVAIQCKMYSSSVGNKSVQEAFSAKGYYDCDCACVISNSSFTPAAKQAAAKLDVALLHHEDIAEYFSF